MTSSDQKCMHLAHNSSEYCPAGVCGQKYPVLSEFDFEQIREKLEKDHKIFAKNLPSVLKKINEQIKEEVLCPICSQPPNPKPPGNCLMVAHDGNGYCPVGICAKTHCDCDCPEPSERFD